MTETNRTRPETLEAALRALEEAEEKLRAYQTDETGVRRLTESVRRSEERFRALAEGVPNHLLFLDRDLRIEFTNDVFLEAAGWSEQTAVGLHISELMGPERFLQRQPYYERALAGETVSYESTGAIGNENGYFRFSYRPSFDESGNVRGIFSMATDISARRKIELELEFSERSLMAETEGARECLYALKNIGVRLAIDDFGAGLSCLSYLRQFPLDVLKIDRSFVSALDTSEDAQIICSGILSIANRFLLEAVAKGIESAQQEEFLTRHDCLYGQGDYFSAPSGPDQIRAMLVESGGQATRRRRVTRRRIAMKAG